DRQGFARKIKNRQAGRHEGKQPTRRDSIFPTISVKRYYLASATTSGRRKAGVACQIIPEISQIWARLCAGRWPTADLRPPRRSPSIEWKTHPRPSPLPAVGLGVSASALITRHVALLHDAEEGASRVRKHNEVVSSTIPPGISPRSQSDQSLNFGLLV